MSRDARGAYNRVLLERSGFHRVILKSGKFAGYVHDVSAFPYLIEEFIALGAVEIAVPSALVGSVVTVDDLPAALKRRIVRIDDQRAFGARQALFEPIAEEFDLKLTAALHFRRPLEEELDEALAKVYFPLYSFLLGLEYELQIDIDPRSIRIALGKVRRASRNPESRAVLSVLEGIFSTYAPRKVDAVQVTSLASDRLVRIFQDFVVDETYRRLSGQVRLLGFPRRVDRALTLIQRLARTIVTKAPFKQMVTLAARGISTATRLPVPDSDMAASLLKKGYLPPAISLKRATHRAWKNWRATNPKLVSPSWIALGDAETRIPEQPFGVL